MDSKLNKSSIAYTDSRVCNAQYPSVAVLGSDVYVAWDEHKDGHDYLYAANLVDGKLKNQALLSQGGDAFRPDMHSFDGKVWFVWSECKDMIWTLYVSWLENGVYSSPIMIDQGMAVYNHSISDDGENIMVLWSRLSAQRSDAMLAIVTTAGVKSEEKVSQSQKSYRPTACRAADGRLYVAYDVFDGKVYNAVLRVYESGQWSDEHRLNDDDGMWATQPIVVPHENGVIVSWYDFGAQSKLSYLSAKAYWDGKLCSEKAQRFAQRVSWYQDMDASYNKDYAIVVYTWGKYNVHVRVKKNGEDWSKPFIMSNQDGECGTHPKIVIDDQNVIHLAWQFSPKNGHYDRNATAMYNTIHVDDIAEFFDEAAELISDSFTTPIPTPKVFEKPTKEAMQAWLKKNGYSQKIAFGDIHGQSGLSDGAGQIDQYYHFAMSTAGLEFASLTDHDSYPDWTTKSEWEWMRTSCKLVNMEDDFASLLSYEWTPNEYRYDYGHKNIYYPGDDGEMFRSNEVGGITPYKLFESIKAYGGQCIPHHPAAMWGMVSAATDWTFGDESVQRLVETYSRHAAYERFEDKSVYTKDHLKCEGCCAQDALAMGHRIGLIAGSDSHQMEHGIEGGIMGAFLPEITRQNLFDAMFDRFVFGTTGARILPSIKIGDAVMGQEIKCAKDASVNIDVSVLCTQQGKVELIKNNKVVATHETQNLECDFTYVDDDRSESDYYYLRVTQNDEHMAWSSPIWVDAI